MILFECEIFGRPIVKKNTMRRQGRRFFYTKRFYSWQECAALELLQARGEAISIPGDLSAYFGFYFKNRQAEADVSNLLEGVQDALQKFGVIQNDKQIVCVTGQKFFGYEPKTVIRLYRFPNDAPEEG